MDPRRWRRIEELFHAASVMEAERRQEYLVAECAGDDALRDEVLSLLRESGRGDSLLHAEIGRAAAQAVDVRETAQGEKIGAYRVLRLLGRGGMGTVYLAERADDTYHKQVAIKLVRTGFGTEESLRRFRAERQILAKLEHPHIARLLDGGATDDGQPYVVMEFVDGQPLLDYCSRKRLDLRARLGLFLQICGAVEYAHRNLIVHRDIKPGNVLVNSEGVVKLVDFGIAKLLAEDPIASTATLSFERLLTPQYASPEQVLGAAISTASDVYSLGALLYELLTGKPPLEFEARSAAEIERVITTEQAAAPSVRCGYRALAGDLDNIVLMALRKEPERRYPSASALAADIQRYLSGYPVQAREEGLPYRAAKFVRRNRVAVAAAALFALILAGFVATVIRERNSANRERVKAEQVSKFLVKSFELANPSEARGRQVTAREVLEQGVTRLDNELRDQPGIQTTLMDTIAEAYLSLGLLKDSVRLNALAIEKAKQAGLGESPEMADLLSQRSYLLRESGQYKAAMESMQQAFAMLARVAPKNNDRRARYLRSYGPLLYMAGDPAEAEKVLREALALRRRVSGENHEEITWNLSNLSRALTDQRKYKEALAAGEEALAVARRLHGEVSLSAMASYNRIGLASYHLRDAGRGVPAFRNAVEIARKLFGPEHKDVAAGLNGLGGVLEIAGKQQESLAAHRESIAIFRKAYGGSHPVLAQSLTTFSFALHRSGAHEEEAAVAEESIQMALETVGKDSARWSNASANLARVKAERGDFEGSLQAYEEAMRFRWKTTDARDETTHSYLVMMSGVARLAGQCARVEPLLREAVNVNRDVPAPVRKTQRDEARTVLAACALDRHEIEGVEKTLREVLAGETENRLKPRLFPAVRYQLGRLLLMTGRAAEAEPLLKAAHETLRGVIYLPVDRGLCGLAYARCLRALGKDAGTLERDARAVLAGLRKYPVVSAALNRQ